MRVQETICRKGGKVSLPDTDWGRDLEREIAQPFLWCTEVSSSAEIHRL